MHTEIIASYMGIELRSPLIVGACPLTLKPETVRELAIAGAGAVVLPSLLEEQVVRRMMQQADAAGDDQPRAESDGGAHPQDDYNRGVDRYLMSISRLKQHAGIPVIANLNGCTDGRWVDVAGEVERAGADAIELSIRTDSPDPSIGADAIEASLVTAVKAVSDRVSIPVSVKLLPFFTSLSNVGRRLAQAGASGIVLFGREPSWEFHNGDLIATTHWTLSGSAQLQTTVSGLVRMCGNGSGLSIAASGGIVTTRDLIHAVVAGADVAMVTSEIYRNGPDAVAHLLEGLVVYLQREGFASFREFLPRRRAARPKLDRQSSIGPMTRVGAFPDTERRAEPARPTSDRWGHVQGTM